MLELVILVASWIILRRALFALERTAPANTLAPKRINAQLTQLSTYADRLFTERKWLAAEKAYLSVLKLDHKNLTAYAHLGIIYSTQKNMPDAIECLEIAARLKPSGRAFQNLGLAYYENRNYIKSIAAYEKAIMFEPHAARYVGVGKAHLKLHNLPAAISAIELAVKLDPAKSNLERLADTYDQAGRKHDAKVIYTRIHNLDPADLVAARRIGIILPDIAPPLDSAF